jgi:hypothetical protein
MAIAPPPLQLLAFWTALWPQIQADIMANGFHWGVTRRNNSLTRQPPFPIDANTLGLPQAVLDSLPPYRIVVIVTPGGNRAPAVDNAGATILQQQLSEAGLPPNINFAHGAPQGRWFDINAALVP